MSDEMFRFETAQFIVRATISPCDDLDLSWDEDGETAAKLDSGEYVAFDTTVSVILKATGTVVGSDHLGESIYAQPADFFMERGGYFTDMVGEAIADARRTLARMPALRSAA